MSNLEVLVTGVIMAAAVVMAVVVAVAVAMVSMNCR